MDSELGRCRRTDGKKWRCSKDVLPDQKYCERHMHRGRQRSRKHVEITKNVTKSNSPKIFNSNKTTITINLPESAKKKSVSSTQLPEILQPIHNPSSNTSNKVCSASTPACTTSPIVYNRRKDNGNILRNSKSSTVAPASDTLPKGVLQSGVGTHYVVCAGYIGVA